MKKFKRNTFHEKTNQLDVNKLKNQPGDEKVTNNALLQLDKWHK